MSFKNQIILTFSLISFISLSLGGLISYTLNAKIVDNLAQQDLKSRLEDLHNTAKISALENQDRLTQLMNFWGKSISTRVEFLDTTTSLEVENQVSHEKKILPLRNVFLDKKNILEDANALQLTSQQSGSAVTLFVLHPEGLVRVSTSLRKADGKPAVGTYIPKESPVYKSVTEGKRYLGRAVVLGSWYVTAYEPVIQNGKVQGAFFMGFPETSTQKILDHLRAEKLYSTGYYYIMDAQGTLVLHPQLEGQNLSERPDADGNLVFKKILDTKEGFLRYPWKAGADQPRQEKGAFYRYIPELDWYLVASIDMDHLQSDSRAVGWTILLITVISTLVVILVSALYGRRVSKYIEEISHKLNHSSEVVQSSVTELADAVQQLSGASTSSAASLEETAASLEEVSSTINSNSQNSKHAAELSAEAYSAALEGESHLKQLISSMKATESSSKKIEEITSVIDDLAFQTNLLALNAAVEAARAGEQGKGFAVVAEAVRSLAQRSGSAAKDISILIQEIVGKIHSGAEVADKSEEALAKIVHKVQKVANLNEEIAVSSAEQSKGIHQVNQAVNQLDSDSQMNAKVASDVAQSSEDIKVQILEVSEKASALDHFVKGSKAG